MKAVYLVMHQKKANWKELVAQAVDAFRLVGMAVYAEPWLWERLGSEASSFFVPSPSTFHSAPVDAVISMGGDGTLLRANQVALQFQVPLLGINVGRIGFLAEVEMAQLPEAARRLQADDFSLEPRMMLEATLENGDKLTALNDVVVSRGGSSRLIAVNAWVDQESAGRYIADGLVVSTPTGSTGYSLSAGGPIVCPDMECIILSPICAHSLQHRPVVTSSKQHIVLELDCEENRHAQLSIDGQDPISLGGKQRISILRSPQEAQFIRLEPKGFFNLIRYKLSEWSSPKEG